MLIHALNGSPGYDLYSRVVSSPYDRPLHIYILAIDMGAHSNSFYIMGVFRIFAVGIAMVPMAWICVGCWS
jgi:hypothetical protein